MEKIKNYEDFVSEQSMNEGGIGFDTIADGIFRKLKNKRDWEKAARKEILAYTKDKDTIIEIMNMLHSEDYFDDGVLESQESDVNEKAYTALDFAKQLGIYVDTKSLQKILSNKYKNDKVTNSKDFRKLLTDWNNDEYDDDRESAFDFFDDIISGN